jgi:hypothetical protein
MQNSLACLISENTFLLMSVFGSRYEERKIRNKDSSDGRLEGSIGIAVKQIKSVTESLLKQMQ